MDKKIFAVVGGDNRQNYIYNSLSKKGYSVTKLFLDNKNTDYENQIKKTGSSDIIVLPVPASKDGHTLNAPYYFQKISLDEIVKNISANCTVFSGGSVNAFEKRNDINFIDILKDESFLTENALATAEAATAKIISSTDFTVYDSRSIILGYGRIGKFMAKIMKSLNAEVTVFARRNEVITQALTDGFSALNFDKLDTFLPYYDIIINTVPSMILDRQRLLRIKKNCYIIDLASEPGGMDFCTANNLNLNFEHALSLPGKTSPASAAHFIEKRIMKELESGVI